MKKIKLIDIDETPCAKYISYIGFLYGRGKFDPIEVFENVPGGANITDVIWLLEHCPKSRTKEMFEYALSHFPDAGEYCELLVMCWRDFPAGDNKRLIAKLKEMKPDVEDVSWVIARCRRARTKTMLKYYMSLDPKDRDISWLLTECEFARNSGIVVRKNLT